MQTMSMLCSITKSCQLCKLAYSILTLNVALCNVLLHSSKFCLCLNLSSVADVSNTRTRVPTLAERVLFFTHVKGDAV